MDTFDFSSPPSTIFDDVSLDDVKCEDDVKREDDVKCEEDIKCDEDIKCEDEEEELSVRVEINQDIKGYWELESSLRTKPMWSYLSLAVQQEPMDIMARSRNGDYMV
jgi:hypothetical protein